MVLLYTMHYAQKIRMVTWSKAVEESLKIISSGGVQISDKSLTVKSHWHRTTLFDMNCTCVKMWKCLSIDDVLKKLTTIWCWLICRLRTVLSAATTILMNRSNIPVRWYMVLLLNQLWGSRLTLSNIIILNFRCNTRP